MLTNKYNSLDEITRKKKKVYLKVAIIFQNLVLKEKRKKNYLISALMIVHCEKCLTSYCKEVASHN